MIPIVLYFCVGLYPLGVAELYFMVKTLREYNKSFKRNGET